MTASYWRMRRAWAIETRMLETSLESQAPGSEISRLAAAFTYLPAAPQLGLLHRYEARLHLCISAPSTTSSCCVTPPCKTNPSSRTGCTAADRGALR